MSEENVNPQNELTSEDLDQVSGGIKSTSQLTTDCGHDGQPPDQSLR